MVDDTLVLRQTSGGVARLTVNRPDKLNALDAEVLSALRARFEEAGLDPEVRAIVLTGAGAKAFVAGADIAEMAALAPEAARAFARAGQSVADAIDASGKPVVAAVNGWALGGGCELAMMCHLRVAAPTARFGQPEVGLGLIPGFGGTQRLARLVGEGRALELILLGKPIDAETALSWGLVNRIARERDAVDEATVLAGEIAAQGPAAVRLAIAAVRSGLSMPLGEALAHEAALFGVVFGTEDMREGTAAFVEKRKPTFRGR
ncbi:MAG: enoyl-CoA hydratase-related protein [Acidobacteria bacterium]|jgi:enoyl-CoA hydratase|nr:enoyl-CoA hydratase-related protein [Acidobacteriota bacterium]